MKYYLLTFEIADNGHNYFAHITTDANTIEEARIKGWKQEHGMKVVKEDELTMFDQLGDGKTRSHLVSVEQVTPEEMRALEKLAVAYFYQL